MSDTKNRLAHTSGIVLLCTFLATACTGPIVLGTIYNGASNRVTKQVNSYANFTDEQQRVIENHFSGFHNWHRTSQLPLYLEFVLTLANELDNEAITSPSTVKSWIVQVDIFSKALRRCNPINSSGEFLKQLSDSQVQQIANSFKQKQKAQLQKYNLETATQRRQKRQEDVSKWIGRAGLKVNKQQKLLISSTVTQQIDLGKQRMDLWQQWSADFIRILGSRHQRDFDTTIRQHIKSLWNLTETTYPGEWQFNKQLWTEFAHQYLNLQTESQRQVLIRKAQKFAATLGSISKKKTNSVTPHCFSSTD